MLSPLTMCLQLTVLISLVVRKMIEIKAKRKERYLAHKKECNAKVS
jgi:hypothetical protein